MIEAPDKHLKSMQRIIANHLQSVYLTIKSFEAGARGVLASRDYDEMRLSSIEAFGNAVRDWKARHVR